MLTELILPLSISSSIITWIIIFLWYVHPLAQRYSFAQVIKPLLILHCFRYVGLMFLVPGVTAEVLDVRFAHYAAYGDLGAAILAFVALAAIRLKANWAILSVWVFSIWGSADLFNAIIRGLMYTPDGHFGATFWIPATLVPLLLVTHGYIFYLLIQQVNANIAKRSRPASANESYELKAR